ncbi:hypothetical protein HDU92_009193 [Lobulomyces angularis]|nr:hypothetical protein HDU92_009193 [Lobulomyces angularis]
MQSALVEANEKKIIDANINLEFYDSEEKPDKTMKKGYEVMSNKIYNNAPLIGIYGEYYSSRTMPLALASTGFNIVQCSGLATSPTLADKNIYKTFFRTTPNDNFQGPALANLAFNYGWKKVALINENSVYGQGLSQSFQKRAAELNIVIATHLTFTSGQKDFMNEVEQIKNSYARIIIVIVYNLDAIPFLRDANKQGMIGPNYVYLGTDSTSDMEGFVQDPIEKTYFQGYIAITAYDRVNTEATTKLNETFYPKFKDRIPNQSGFSHDCILAFIYGFQNFLNTTNTKIEDYKHLKPEDRVTLKNIQNITFEGMSGTVAFDSNGEPRSRLYMIKNYIDNNMTTVFIGTIDSGGNDRMEIKLQNSVLFNGFTTLIPSDTAGEYYIKLNDPGTIIVLYCSAGRPNVFTKSKLLGIFFSVLLIEFLILLSWAILNPFALAKIEKEDYFYLECQSINQKLQQKFDIILITYNGVLILTVLLLAYKSRNVVSEFKESYWTSQLSVNVILCALVTIIMLSMSSDNSIIHKFYIKMIPLAFGSAFIYWSVVGRIILTVLFTKIPESNKLMMSRKKLGQQNSKSKALKSSNSNDNLNVSILKAAKKTSIFTVMAKNESLIFSAWKSAKVSINEFNFSIHYLNEKKKFLVQSEGVSISLNDAVIEELDTDTFRIISIKTSFIVLCTDESEKKALVEQIKLIQLKETEEEDNDALYSKAVASEFPSAHQSGFPLNSVI